MIDVCAINRLVDEIDFEKLRQIPDSAVWELLDRCRSALVEAASESEDISITEDEVRSLESCCSELDWIVSSLKENMRQHRRPV